MEEEHTNSSINHKTEGHKKYSSNIPMDWQLSEGD